MLSAQPSPPADASSGDYIFRDSSQMVLVDAVVTDKNGNVRRNLTAQDFKILEDGKEQKITGFSLESVGGTGQYRPFVALLFEEDNLDLRNAALRFIHEFAGPDVYIAIYARIGKQIQLQQGFTTDVARLTTALTDLSVIGYDDKPPESWQHDTHLAGIAQVATDLAPVRGHKALVDLGWNRAVVRNPGDPENRWAPPWPPPIVAQLAQTAETCNRADVSFYSFQLSARNLSAGDFVNRPEPPRNPGATLNVTQNLAVQTSGRFTELVLDSLSSFLGSVVPEREDYYLLGFKPSADSSDQPCHKLKVIVNGKGLEVNARESYCVSGVPGSRDTKSLNALQARASNGDPGAVRVGLQLPWFYPESDKPLVEVAMDIDPSAMKITGKLRGEIDVSGLAYREDRSIAARFGDTLKLEFKTQEQMNAFMKTPFHYSNEFSVPPGRYDVRTVAGSVDQAFGSVSKTLNIDPWNGQTLEVSALALSDSEHPLPALTADLSNQIIAGAHRLGSKGRETVPMGGTEFHTSGLGFFFFEVYDPRLAKTTGMPVAPPGMQIRILERMTGAEKENSGHIDVGDWIKPGDPVIPIALTLPVAKLTPGAYTLEVRVAHDGESDGVIRTADFDVK